jgi:raffinose/stachyose/melibiose transport system substrate-binding protein
MDLTGKIDSDNYLPAALNISMFDGKVYGAPLLMSLTYFYYNKEIFEKFNLKPPGTFGELLEIVDKLKAENIIPISLANKTKWPGALYLIYLANRIGGPDVFTEAYERTGRGFDDEAFVKAGELIQQLVDRGAFNSGFNGLQYDTGQSRQLMYTEKAAMELQVSSYITNVKSEMPGFEEKLDIFPFPTVEGGKGNGTDLVGGVSPVFSISSSTKYPEEALELLKALTSKELAQKIADLGGTVSAVKGVVYRDEFTIRVNELLERAEYLQTFYDQTLPPEMAELHKDTTQAIFGKTMTPEEAARQMEEAANQYLE